jgi:hypothetical protein
MKTFFRKEYIFLIMLFCIFAAKAQTLIANGQEMDVKRMILAE